MKVLLVSTYELGHQPLAVAGPAGRPAGPRPRRPLPSTSSIDPWDPDARRVGRPGRDLGADAHRGAPRATSSRRRIDGPVACYGLYAGDVRRRRRPRSSSRDPVAELVRWIEDDSDASRPSRVPGPRPPAAARALRAARSQAGEQHLVASVEASQRLRAPLPALPGPGRLRRAHPDQRRRRGARRRRAAGRHGGPARDLRRPRLLQRRAPRAAESCERSTTRFPDLTFDCTVKVEHILRHADVWSEMAASGCLFVVSAFESRQRRDARAARQGPHRGRRRARRSRCCVRTASRSGRRGCRSRRGPRSTTSATSSSSSPSTTSSATSIPCSTRSGCWFPRARCCSATSTDSGRGTPPASPIRGPHRSTRSTRDSPPSVRGPGRRPDPGGLRRVAGRGRPARRSGLTELAPSPRLDEPWFCCAEPTDLQLRAI